MKPACFLLLVSVLVLAACTPSLSEEQAEGIALQFTEQNGRFYSGDETFANLTITVQDSQKVKNVWEVMLLIQAEKNNTPVSNTILVLVNPNGQAAFAGAKN